MKSFALFGLIGFGVLGSAVAGCATATSPDGGGETTDAGSHDISIVDTGVGGDTTVTDTKTDAPCLAPKKTCGAACVDTSTDRSNCGTCGKACGDAETCVGRTCGAAACGTDEVRCPDGK